MNRLFWCGIPLLLACSTSDSTSSADASTRSGSAWRNVPSAVVVYEGRTTDVPLDVDSSASIEPTAAGNLEVEVLPGLLRIRAGYGLDDASIEVVVVSGAERETIPLPLEKHALSWRRSAWTDQGPQAREHAVFAYDATENAAYMLQGSGYAPQWKPIEDSWRLDVSKGAWTPWTPRGDVPPAGGGRRLVQGRDGTAFVLGGYVGWDDAKGDTTGTDENLYRLSGGVFTRLRNVGTTASGRQLHAMGYDAEGDQLVVYGGFTDTPRAAILDDTWLVAIAGDEAKWSEVRSAKAPEARYGAFSAFDREARRFVVWSGARIPTDAKDPVNAADDAWALDLGASPPAWSRLSPEGTAPPGRRNGCAMHDPVGRRLFVFGGTADARTSEKGLFVLSLEPGHERWSRLDLPDAPAVRSSGFGFTTSDGQMACGFGNGDDAYTDLNFLGYFD